MSFWQTFKSVLWAMFGVRRERDAELDFRQGKASHFIVIGVIFALIFIAILAFLVHIIIPA